MNASSEFDRVRRSVGHAVDEGIDQAVAFLASPPGKTVRAIVATGLVIATPAILRHPFFRTPVGRVIEIAGAAAVIAKAADVIREWEPTPATAPSPGPPGATP